MTTSKTGPRETNAGLSPDDPPGRGPAADVAVRHDRHPLTTAERVQEALDGVGPQLKDVTPLGIADDAVRLRSADAGKGCSSARVVDAVERVIASAAPEISVVELGPERPLL